VASSQETTGGPSAPIRSAATGAADGGPTEAALGSTPPDTVANSGRGPATRWQRRVDQLNFETSEAAATAFAKGATAGTREFVCEPLRAFVQACLHPPSPPRFFAAMLAGYTALVYAAKLWEIEMYWRDFHLESFHRGRLSGVVRKGWRDGLEQVLTAGCGGDRVEGGRGATRRISTDRGTIIARRFRRGGAMRWLGESYFGLRPRPLREFDLLLRARRRGLPVPEPIAAVVQRRFAIAYRGQLLMAEVAGGRPLLEVLRESPRQDLMAGLAQSLRLLHDAGLRHPDLNLGNLLVVSGLEGSRVVVVDLDRAHLQGSPLDDEPRRRGLRRLRRSAAKLDPQGRWLPPRELDRMEELYWSRNRDDGAASAGGDHA
jgi:3-deoxy-D-manno-octulosonic acid kinase